MSIHFCIAFMLTISFFCSANGQGLEDIGSRPDRATERVEPGDGRDRDDPQSRERAKIALGEKLFFDPLLSGSHRTACASCHNPAYGWTEPRPVAILDNGKQARRNAATLLDVDLKRRLMWDGRFRSLEEQVFSTFFHDGDMGLSIEEAVERLRQRRDYLVLFDKVYHDEPTPVGIAAALAAFERKITTGYSRFDRFFLKGDSEALTPQEIHGFEIFTGKGNCVACHQLNQNEATGTPLFTDFKFHNDGIGFHGEHFRDDGLGKITGLKADLGAFRTPSLRNVALTAPYMHDGSLPDLREVVEFYNAGGILNPNQSPILHPLGLSEREKAALVAFLKSLTSEELERNRVAVSH